MNERVWYPINSLERQSVILELTASAAFEKQNPKQNIILSNYTFYNLSVDIYLKTARAWIFFFFFSGGHQRRFEVTLSMSSINLGQSRFACGQTTDELLR